MSRLGGRSKPSLTERVQQSGDYKLFLGRFHGSGLEPIREKFVELVKDGLRRRMFVIDVDEEMREYSRFLLERTIERGSSLDTESLPQPPDELTVTLAAIDQRREQFDKITQQIKSEKEFDIVNYWMEEIGRAKSKTELRRSTLAKKLDQSERRKQKSSRGLSSKQDLPELVCPQIIARLHSKVGRGVSLSKRKFIEDEPQKSKLFIVVLGGDTNKLCFDLLRENQPLQAIVHFIPKRTAYDRLVPRPSYENYLFHIAQDVNKSFESLRIPNTTKPIGLLHQPLPVISRCLAQKHAGDIYDELSWYFYDVELLYLYYQVYYVAKFVELNVTMDSSVKMRDLYYIASSLNLQGHFLKTPIPAAATDLASIVMFLEGLISVVELPEEAEPEYKALLYSGIWMTSIFSSYGSLSKIYQSAFKSITNIKRFNRLVVERNNLLISSLISYMNIDNFTHIHQSCLEYDILRRYILSPYVTECVQPNPVDLELEPFYLPQFCKLFLTHDGVMQRLTHLLTEYDDYEVDNLHPGYTLYHFRRRYNEIIQQQRIVVMPTRLCFRDFTLFQMEEFLRDLVTPEQRKSVTEAQMLDSLALPINMTSDLDPNIFIRKRSLQAKSRYRPTQSDALSGVKPTRDAGPHELPKRKTRLTSVQDKNKPKRETFVGLPPGHHLLQGYNMDDVRQEILVKSSLYYFEEGYIKLYEDSFCRHDLNKNVHLKINKCSFNFCPPRKTAKGISRNIQFRTKNDVSCRVMAKEAECAQIVINYPNSLSVYFHSDYCEQKWSLQETVNDEARRLMIPEGAVIVYYNPEDVVRVLRHNGEVYELYQIEIVTEEDEIEEDDDTVQDSDDITDDIQENKQQLITRISSDSYSKSVLDKPIPKKQPHKMLYDSIQNEMRFLEMISAKYGLSYLRLKVTTSVGRRLDLTYKGEIFRRRPLKNTEWHDYFANESYAMRSDGVKRIWTKDTLKCFHKDGTIISTALEEVMEEIVADYEFDSQVSVSSSHYKEEGVPRLEENKSVSVLPPDSTGTNVKRVGTQSVAPELPPTKDVKRLGTQTDNLPSAKSVSKDGVFEQYLIHGTVEEEEAEDNRYVCYQSDRFLILHKSYAAVRFIIHEHFLTNYIKVFMNIFAADNIEVQFTQDDNLDVELNASLSRDLYTESKDFYTDGGEGSEMDSQFFLRCKSKETVMDATRVYESSEKYQQRKTIKVNIDTDVEVKVTDEAVQINALVERYDKKCGQIRDILKLDLDFDENIVSLFHKFVQLISQFKNYRKPTAEHLYFLQKDIYQNCSDFQGFEFYRKLPELGKYSYSAGNTTIDMKAFSSAQNLMDNNYEWFEKDMKKFPRLQSRQPKRNDLGELPSVMDADFYCKIPRRLSHTEEIKKFLDPFDRITFKRMRIRLREALHYHRYPRQILCLQQLSSKMSWRHRHREHYRLMVIRTQRTGLYQAMLRHQTYPKYHQFTHDFDNHVSNIDFFQFVQHKCTPRTKAPTSI